MFIGRGHCLDNFRTAYTCYIKILRPKEFGCLMLPSANYQFEVITNKSASDLYSLVITVETALMQWNEALPLLSQCWSTWKKGWNTECDIALPFDTVCAFNKHVVYITLCKWLAIPMLSSPIPCKGCNNLPYQYRVKLCMWYEQVMLACKSQAKQHIS